MAVERFTVRNPHIYGVSIFINDGKAMRYVPPHRAGKDGTARITEEDIRFNESVSSVFSAGHLFIDQAETMKEELEITPPAPMTDAEIKKLLRLSIDKFTQALSSIKEEYNIARVIEVASSMVTELAANKIAAIKDITGYDITPTSFDEP